jgi:hypothetical protein
MELRPLAANVIAGVQRAADQLGKFAKLERILAVVCFFTPLLLLWADPGSIRDSISAYYDMEQNQWFYFLLTVASMLFIVNGVIKQQHSYNTGLGIVLAGVILANHVDHVVPHMVFAALFFGGNAIVILFSTGDKRIKWAFMAFIGLAVIGFLVLEGFTLFWLEWASLGVIAVHYILSNLVKVPYEAVSRSEKQIRPG